MIEGGGELVFGAGSVCFPNRWDLRSKLGLPLRDVHAPGQPAQRPARRHDRQVLRPADPGAQLLAARVGRARQRRPVPAARRHGRSATGDAGAADLVVRVERETLRRFPRTGCVLFTIRTHLAKATELAADPRHGPVIAEALAAMPPTVRQYKQIDRVAAALAELFV